MTGEVWVGGTAVWLGAVFAFAGCLKLARPDGVREVIVRRLGLRGSQAKWLASALAIGEVGAGLLLALGVWPVFMAGLVSLLLCVFTAFLLTAATATDAACGCFGFLDASGSGRAIGVARNIVLLLAAITVAFGARLAGHDGITTWSTASMFLGTCLFLGSAAMYVVIRQLAEPLHG